jgi:hypothetical protein
MGNNFLHTAQTIDWLGEDGAERVGELWKSEPIDPFVLITQRWVNGNQSMTSTFTSLFRKTAACPTSRALLAFRGSLLDTEGLAQIESHLACCDFCSAELQLLSRYRSEVEEYSFVEMPAQLRRLAESLLKRRTVPFKGLPDFAEHQQLSH